MILFNVMIFAFGFWNVFKNIKPLNSLFGLAFIGSLLYCIGSFYMTIPSMNGLFLHIVPVLLGMGVLGFILQAFAPNKLAQIATILVAAAGVNLYVSNPHNVLDPSLALDENAELIIRIEHDQKTKSVDEIRSIPGVKSVNKMLQPNDAENTELDDYFTIDLAQNTDKNLMVGEIKSVNGVEWLEPNEIMKVEPIESKIDVSFSPNFPFNDPLVNRQWNAQALDLQSYHGLFLKGKFSPKKRAHLSLIHI